MEAQIFRYSNWLHDTRPSELKIMFQHLLEKSGFTVLAVQEHHFEPIGYTCLWLLGESHFALHTFPEQDATYIELSSCNRGMHQEFVHEFEKKCTPENRKDIELSYPKLSRSLS